MPPDPITGFHHTSMITANLDRAATFWRDVLGFTAWHPISGDRPVRSLFADAHGSPGSIVELQSRPDSPSGRWGVGGIHHVALGTSDRTTQLMWKRWLQDHGVSVSGPYDRGYFHSIYFRDPDGHVIEIATAGPGYDHDEPAGALGERFIGASEHGSRLRGARDEASIDQESWPDPVPAISDAMALDGIHHITGITDDMAAADKFFRVGLGLPLIKRTVNQDDGKTQHWFWARYDGREVKPRSSMTLFGWPGSDYRARSGTGTTRHVAWRVPDDNALDSWHVHLESEGYSVDGPHDRGFTRTISVNAPDGLEVHLATDGPGLTPIGDKTP